MKLYVYKKIIFLTFSCYLLCCGTVYSQYNPTFLSRVDNPVCESRVKVTDEQSSSCLYNSGYDVWYPVVIENFNYKEDIPNEWMFNRGGNNIDDEGGVACNGGSYYGPGLFAYNNGNFDVSNGIGYLKVKNEYIYNANPNCPGKMYHFTNAVLYSEFKIKQGYVYATLRLPNNFYMWPAFWLQKIYPSSGYSEIDVFEFYDHDLRIPAGNCDSYDQMRMTIWENKPGSNSPDCKRGRKFPVSSNFFNNFHTFSLFLGEDKIMISLDGNLKGIAKKYYKQPFIGVTLYSCNYGGDAGIPSYIYTCKEVQNLQSCNIQCWGGIFGNTGCCWDYNQVYKDLNFPNPSSSSYQVRISNWLTNKKYDGMSQYLVNALENAWNNYSDVDKEIGIDRVIIYQPIKCYKVQNIQSINDFKNETVHTNFLSGSKITLSNYHITPSDVWPTYLLATDQIEITPTNNDVIFEEGTFLRAEIIDCSTSIGVSQRTMPNGDTPPPVLPINYFDNDTLLSASMTTNNGSLMSDTDNGALQIFPQPAYDYFYISLDEEDWNDLQRIELITPLGQVTELPKFAMQNVSEWSNGLYFLKFYFSGGVIVVKPLMIQR